MEGRWVFGSGRRGKYLHFCNLKVNQIIVSDILNMWYKNNKEF